MTSLITLGALLAATPSPAAPSAEQTYSVAMHQHAGMSEDIGSMEWHTDRATQTGAVDLIWWTDHDWRLDHWRHTTSFDFENATLDGDGLGVTEPDDAYPGEFRSWDFAGFSSSATLAVVDTLASQGTKSMRFSFVHPLGLPSFASLGLTQLGTRKQNKYSLAKRPKLRFSIFPEVIDPVDSRFVIEVTLSEHPMEDHVLRYVGGSMDGEGADTIPLTYVAGQWNTYELDVTADAIAQFTSGGADTLRAEDNSLHFVTVKLETRNFVNSTIFVDDYQILTNSLDGMGVLQVARDLGDLYETMYPAVKHFVGTEISRYRAQPHLNSYTPQLAMVDYTGTVFSDSIFYAVDQIHAAGGAVSLNHMFGTGGYGTFGETEAQKDARAQTKKSELLASNAYNCDLLEIGYRIRAGIDLVRYLDIWDALTGNGMVITANGVTDSHGSSLYDGWGAWSPGNIQFENNFVTWFHSPAFDKPSLIRAMKGGRAFFGDPYSYDADGTMDLCTAEGFPMGRVVVTDRSSHDVFIDLTGVPAGASIRFLQGEIRESPAQPYLDVNYLRDEFLTAPITAGVFSDTVTVDTTLPCFVRVEVDDQGTASAYSNPLHFHPSVPVRGVAGPRVAAVVGDVKITYADEFTLTGLVYTPGAPVTRLVVSGDEETPGLGEIRVDTGVLGAPDGVIGGGFTVNQFQNGVLTLVGMTGAGSSVEILWGATGATSEAPRVDRVELSAGRPNPFGSGTVAEFALPRPASAFLEVLDVSGRRVRLLADERLDAGRHRVSWDGRDADGRSVANGVYFFRLRTGGEVLTSKAVRIR